MTEYPRQDALDELSSYHMVISADGESIHGIIGYPWEFTEAELIANKLNLPDYEWPEDLGYTEYPTRADARAIVEYDN